MSVEIHDAVLILPVVGVVVGDQPQQQQQQQQQQPQVPVRAAPVVPEQAGEQGRPRRRAPAPPQNQNRGRARGNGSNNNNNTNANAPNRELPPPPGVPPIEYNPRLVRGIKLENSSLQGVWENMSARPNDIRTEIYQTGNEIVVVNDSRAWSPSVGRVHSDYTITFHEGGLIPLKAVLDVDSQNIHFCNGVTWRRAYQNKKQQPDKKRRKCQKGCAMQ